ncbi:MAG: EVE domain-containing protein [Hyphomonadaceae bacterium]
MAHWLLKTEPDVFSWDDLVKKGKKGEPWNGVRNHTARANLQAMKKGERGFIYHSNEGKEIVGVCEVIRESYPDPTAETGPWVCVDVIAVAPFARPVTLAEVKADATFAQMALVKFSRLSVQPVTDDEWKRLCKLGGVKP